MLTALQNVPFASGVFSKMMHVFPTPPVLDLCGLSTVMSKISIKLTFFATLTSLKDRHRKRHIQEANIACSQAT